MKKLISISVFVFWNIISGYAQNMDSLKTLLKLANHDTTRLNIYKELITICDTKDNLEYAEPAIKIADKNLENLPTTSTLYIFYSTHKASSLNAIGYYYFANEDNKKASL